MTKSPALPQPLMSTQEVADYYNVPLGSVYQWRSRRTGPQGFKVGRFVRYRRADVDAWVDARAAEAAGR